MARECTGECDRRRRGSLAVDDDGELVHTKSDRQTEVLKPEQVIRRWPAAEKQIRQALATARLT